MRQSQANQVFRLPLEREPKVGFVSCSLWLFEALSETLPVSESLIGIWQRFGTNGPFGVGPDPTLLSPGAILKIILSRRTFIWFCLNGGSDRELTQLGRLPGQPNGITVWLSQQVQTEGKSHPVFHIRCCHCTGSRLPWKQAMTVSASSGSITNMRA